MKKVLAVFLLFVSFNLFAQRQENGKITWEFRDYGNMAREPSLLKYGPTSKELEVHVSTTVPRQYFIDTRDNTISFDNYRDSWNMNIIVNQNYFIIPLAYNGATTDRWEVLNVCMDFGHNSTLSPNIRERFLAYRLKPVAKNSPTNVVQSFVVYMNNFQEGTFSWESDFDFDEQEYQFNFIQKVDEKGAHYRNWKITYTIFKE